jgi:hypothetical protein
VVGAVAETLDRRRRVALRSNRHHHRHMLTAPQQPRRQ